eukprot:6134707-Amphidinium_carterae.1
MVRKFNHQDTGVPTYKWRGPLEHKAFWAVRRNADKQNKEFCQEYVWKRLNDNDHVSTLLTSISVKQQAEFHGKHDICVPKDGRIYTLVFQHMTRRRVFGTYGAIQSEGLGLVEAEAVTASRSYQRPRVDQHQVQEVLINKLQRNQLL